MKKIKAFLVAELVYLVVLNFSGIFLYQMCLDITNGVKRKINFNIIQILDNNISNDFFRVYLTVLNVIILLLSLYTVFSDNKGKIYSTGTQRITNKITIPIAAGNGEYGSKHFMNFKELDAVTEISQYNVYKRKAPKKGGFVIGIRAMGSLPKKRSKNPMLYIGKDRHVLLTGSTRSGKSRSMIIESIWLTILAGENMVVSDPKGELWAYTGSFAEEHDYQVIAIDLRSPNRGNHHNYLQEIIEALAINDTAEAIDLTWDLVSVLVGEAKGEPIWHNGECAAIAACILIVAMEAPVEYRNLTNVYYFLFNMAKPDAFGEMPISRYLESFPETHPARAVFAMAEIAHTKTRGSFFSSALGTLRHFTNPRIAEMTSQSDYSFADMVNRKTIIYIILPDEKTTLYGLGSMYIMQHYTYLVKVTNNNGGRCPIDWWYFLDEFGQLPYIPPIPQYLSVGAGRGMRFALALQDFQQLEKRYKDDFDTIKNNCDCWIFLKGLNGKTLKEFSERCGNYTIQVNSSNFTDKGKASQDSHSASLTGRNLLLPDEVGLIESPFSLICFGGKHPIMLISPDLSWYPINKQLGMGDEEHNKELIIRRNAERQERRIGELQLWGVWNDYSALDEDDYSDDYADEQDEGEKFSFLN